MTANSKTDKWLLQSKGHKGSACLIWPYGRDSQGYGRAKMQGMTTRLAHRIMCELVHGPAPSENSLAVHKCGKGHLGCVNPRHLQWGTPKQNALDKRRHGTHAVGSRIAKSVLKDTQIPAIRKMHSAGLSYAKIAKRFSVSRATIQAVVERRTWRHVT